MKDKVKYSFILSPSAFRLSPFAFILSPDALLQSYRSAGYT